MVGSVYYATFANVFINVTILKKLFKYFYSKLKQTLPIVWDANLLDLQGRVFKGQSERTVRHRLSSSFNAQFNTINFI